MKLNRVVFMCALSVLLLGALPAAAGSLLEVRAGVGLNGTDPDDLNDKLGGAEGFDSFDNYNADVYVNLPGPLGIGVRNEWLNDKTSGSGQDWEIDVNHLSVLVDLRLLDNDLLYLGPVVGVGYPWGDLKTTGGNQNFDSGQLTYTLGGEVGLKLGRIILAGEVGYTSLQLETKNSTAKVDLSGFYGKAMVGIGLF